MAELEDLVEGNRAFAANVTLSTAVDRAVLWKFLKRTIKVIGPPLEKPNDASNMDRRDAPVKAHASRQAARQLG
jgi:hypothetical protein